MSGLYKYIGHQRIFGISRGVSIEKLLLDDKRFRDADSSETDFVIVEDVLIIHDGKQVSSIVLSAFPQMSRPIKLLGNAVEHRKWIDLQALVRFLTSEKIAFYYRPESYDDDEHIRIVTEYRDEYFFMKKRGKLVLEKISLVLI